MTQNLAIPPHAAERAATRYTTNENGCWETTYAVGNSGYCTVTWNENGKSHGTTVHRAAWIHHNGKQIPEDSTIVQTCGNKTCVHPDHLESTGKRKTQCDKGHGPENYRKSGNGYRCVVCRRESTKRSRKGRRLKGDAWVSQRARQLEEQRQLEERRERALCLSTHCTRPRREHERPNDPHGLCEYHYDMAMNQPKQRAKGVFVGYTLTQQEIEQALDSRFLTAEEVAQRTGYSVEHVRRLRRKRAEGVAA